MKRRNLPQNSKSQQVRRQRDPLPWRYCVLTLICGLILVAGFFFAARQHFSAIDYGIKNAKLRQMKEDLQSEQRRLNLTREISSAPAEIKKAAKKIGLREFASSSIEAVTRKIEAVNPLAEKNRSEKPKQAFMTVKENSESKENKEVKENKKQTVKQDALEKTDKPKTQIETSGDVRQRVARK